jgi:hypothetical protein
MRILYLAIVLLVSGAGSAFAKSDDHRPPPHESEKCPKGHGNNDHDCRVDKDKDKDKDKHK